MELVNRDQDKTREKGKALNYIGAVNTMAFKIASFAILIIMGLTMYEIFARYCLNAPTTWSHELGAFLCGIAWILGGAYDLIHGHHVRMDALYNRVSLRWRAIFGIIGFPFMLSFLGVLLFNTAIGAWQSFAIRETSPSEWHPSLYPLKIVVALGILLMLGQAVACLCRDISTLTKKGAD